MLRWIFILSVGVAAVVTDVPTARCQAPGGEGVTPDQVRKAIERGAEYLYSQQYKGTGNKDAGKWFEYPGQSGGTTSLVTLALLSCGEDVKSPRIQAALRGIRSIGKPNSDSMVYAVSLQTMALCAAEPEKDMVLIAANARWLESVQIKHGDLLKGDLKGTWGYSSRMGSGDNSNTQFALLALHEAERVGVAVSDETWTLALDYWLKTQRKDGSWGYKPGMTSSGSMTCAGVASVIIASGALERGGAKVEGQTLRCCGQAATDDATLAIENGLKWLGNHFATTYNPTAGEVAESAQSKTWILYYLYGLERVGRMSGRRFLLQTTVDPLDPKRRDFQQQRDWYREGAANLVRMQNPAGGGFWKGSGPGEENEVIGTALALLFLSKGRRPTVMAQVRHNAGDDPIAHVSAVANLTRRIETSWKRDLTWQTLLLNPRRLQGLSGAALAAEKEKYVQDMLESPVLFFSGRSDFALTEHEVDCLKKYVDNGGFIFAEACDGNGCDGKAFRAAFEREMGRVFPESKLRALPPDHAVWYAQQRVDVKALPPGLWLYGIDACCRTSVVLASQSLSCRWEMHRVRKANHPPPIAAEIETCLRIGENVITYATNRELKDKLDRPQVTLAEASASSQERGVLAIAKLAHSGGDDDAPHALANLLRVVEKQIDVRVSTEHQPLDVTDAKLLEYPLAFMHGRRNFQWSPAERKALAQYLQRGGFLFADSICASPQFAESFRKEMKAMFPTARLTRLPADHPLFTDEFRGFHLKTVTLRDPQNRGGENLDVTLTQTEPYLETLEIDGRIAVVFSPYDISCALENQSSLECKGYIKADAAKLGVNVLLQALQQ